MNTNFAINPVDTQTLFDELISLLLITKEEGVEAMMGQLRDLPENNKFYDVMKIHTKMLLDRKPIDTIFVSIDNAKEAILTNSRSNNRYVTEEILSANERNYQMFKGFVRSFSEDKNPRILNDNLINLYPHIEIKSYF